MQDPSEEDAIAFLYCQLHLGVLTQLGMVMQVMQAMVQVGVSLLLQQLHLAILHYLQLFLYFLIVVVMASA